MRRNPDESFRRAGAPGGWYYRAMTRAIPTILALLVLTAVVSVGTLYAQGSSEGERPPYRIDLVAGWNLISFPGDPVDRAIESVIGSDLQVDLVLGYQGGAYSTALRTPDSEWMGSLTEIEGGWGYWVLTSVAETIEAPLTTTPGPFSRCTNGWQLEGVVDMELRPTGTKVDADDYFHERFYGDWKVAYRFDAAAVQWDEPIRPDSGGTLETGAGYWVWASGFPCGVP